MMKRIREIRITRPPDYAAELDMWLLVAFSTKRRGNLLLIETQWRD
jgi:hypothetical protein